ncbi:MAG: methyltransferase domain-containing protein [Candidatus Kerfeldbacteria bacterium]|nr:methyltransferase domain-containing protein [Candidatus Kerfeldbacteria bacterium]
MPQFQRSNSSRPRRPFQPRSQSGGFRKGPRRPQRSFGEHSEQSGEGERREPRFRPEGERPAYSGDRPYRARGTGGSYGDRRGRPSFGKRPYRADGDRPSYGDRPRRSFGDKPAFSDRPRRNFSERPRRDFGNDRLRRDFRDRQSEDRDVQPFSNYRERSYTRDFERDQRKEKTRDTSWEVVSDWYDQMLETDEDSYQNKVVAPHLLRLMNIQYNDRIVDFGCGQGFFARKFAEAGAKVTGVDASADLIAKAQEKAHPETRFIIAPAQDSTLADGCAESVTIVLALQNMEEMHLVFKEAARVLTPRGKLYIVLNHPAFRIPQHSDWIYDESADTQSRRVAQYMSDAKVRIDMTPGQKEHKTFTWSFHHPLQSYMKHLYNAGFVTCRMEEWTSHKESERGPRKKAEDQARKEIPLFLCIEARKQSMA